MILFVCVDDQNGMLFGGRRQSKDRVLRARMLEACGKHPLKMSPYSAAQFEENGAVVADNAYAVNVCENDACFVEDGDFPVLAPQTIVLYRWNRRYPADRYAPLDTLLKGYRLVSSQDFAGSSHERITEEYYEKETHV